MKNYENSKAIVKEDIWDAEENLILLYKGEEVTILSIECEVDGFGSDYVNIKGNISNEIAQGVSTSCLELV